MLLTEPMVTCIAAYASFVYSLLFFQLESFPIVFGYMRNYSTVVSTLPFGPVHGCHVCPGHQLREPVFVHEGHGAEQWSSGARSEATAHARRRRPLVGWHLLVRMDRKPAVLLGLTHGRSW